jgi:L-alanine-DL-glutamate epimerase-like enolase superfamily enzyme
MTQVVVEKTFLNGALTLKLYKYVLTLRSAFGTSHSSTTVRNNALIQIDWNNHRGYGEVGLPPKKKNCYLADFDDIHTYFKQYVENIENEINAPTTDDKYSPFDGIPHPYFDALRSDSSHIPQLLLRVLDTRAITEPNSQNLPEYRFAAICGIEMAILDLWCSILDKPLYSIIGVEPPTGKSAFYTAGLNEDISEMEKTLRFGMQYTDNIKIKLDHDVDKGVLICKRLHDTFKQTRTHNAHWSIDANAAWTPEISLEFLHKIKEQIPEFLPMLYMVEQPFPVELLYVTEDQQTAEKWINVKNEYEKAKIYIFGDESVSTAQHVPRIKPFVHGVNVKLEKAGGVRGALKAILSAKENGLKVWLGSMVSSSLSCTCFAHLMSFAEIGGDLDGGLLVDDNSQILTGNFSWSTPNQAHGVISLPNSKGIGLIPK